MTREELAKHQGPVWIEDDESEPACVAVWSISKELPSCAILGGYGGIYSSVYVHPSESACIEAIISDITERIRIDTEQVQKLNARLTELAGGVDKGI